MSRPLANDKEGVPFELPDTARWWRVTKGTARKGHFKPIYSADGEPLELSIDAPHKELIAELESADDDCAGPYRFVPLDSKKAVVGETFGYAELPGFVGDDSKDIGPRNAAPAREGADLAAALETLASTIKELIEQNKQRDAETMKTLRQTIETLTVSNSAVSQTLARGYGDEIRPVRNPVDVDYETEPHPEPEPEPELTALDKVQQIMAAMPQILEAFEAFKKMSAARNAEPSGTAANGANGAPHGGGFGIHPPKDNGGNGVNG